MPPISQSEAEYCNVCSCFEEMETTIQMMVGKVNKTSKQTTIFVHLKKFLKLNIASLKQSLQEYSKRVLSENMAGV
jgi:hypothetical protein